jgi:hypothetical protein
MSGNSENGVTPYVGVALMIGITVILAGIIAAFVFGMSGNLSRVPFKMTVNDSQNDHIDVYVSNVTSQQPLPNVQIAIYTYDTPNLIAGPLYTNESGLVLFEMPDGFPDHYRVQGTYNVTTSPFYVDRRPLQIRLEEFLGTPLYTAIITILVSSVIVYFKRDRFKLILDKFGKGKDEL